TVYDTAPPGLVVEVPLDSLAEPGGKTFLWLVAQFGHHFARVQSIATVMARTIRDKRDETVCGYALGRRGVGETALERGITAEGLIQQTAQQGNKIEVGPGIMAADVVCLAAQPLAEHQLDPPTVVFHVEPVADMTSVTIEGQGLAFEGLQEHEGDELFWELIWAIVVAAITGAHRQAIRMIIGSYQVIC